MGATLESISRPAFVCRVGEEHHKFGDPFTFVCTVLDMGDGVARLVGASGDTYVSSISWSINSVLVEKGFVFVEYIRRKGGRVHTVRRRLKP